MNDDQVTEFSPTHHALLFAWIARAVTRRAGEARGEAIVRRAVRRYGEQRGRRMALRAQGDGYPLTMSAYRAYGEWRAPEGTTSTEMVREQPDAVQHVLVCPWHRAWEDEGVMPFGRLYCLEIDHALARGFNPKLRLEVNSILSMGDEHCEFVYNEADLAAGIQPKRQTVMPWEYHLGHLYRTMGEVVVEELGLSGTDAMEESLQDYARVFGQDAARAVASYRDVDFDRLPAEPIGA